jgi:hypothetical protein
MMSFTGLSTPNKLTVYFTFVHQLMRKPKRITASYAKPAYRLNRLKNKPE